MNRQLMWCAGLVFAASPIVAHAKKAPAEIKKAQNADLKKISDKWDEVRKAAGGKRPDAGTCTGIAKDFAELGSDGKLAEGYFNAGVVYETCGIIDKAKSSYKDALDANKDFAPAMVNLGELAYREGARDEAERQFNAALAADPKNVQAYNDTALISFEKAKAQNNDPALIKDAVGKLRRALAVDGDSLPAYSLLALIDYTIAENDRSKLDLAELVCKQAREVNDKYPQIYNTQGLIKLKKKNVTGALQDFKTAAELDPNYIEAQLNIGAITLSARDYKSAEAAFTAVLANKPKILQQNFDATMGLGVALRGQRRIDEAEAQYKKAALVDPRNCSVEYNLGVLYQDYRGNAEAGDLKGARDHFTAFAACSGAPKDRVTDSQRRIKDIDDTFKAIEEQKKNEAEAKKLQEEADKMMQQQNAQNPPPPGGGAAPAPAPGGGAASPHEEPAVPPPAAPPAAPAPKGKAK